MSRTLESALLASRKKAGRLVASISPMLASTRFTGSITNRSYSSRSFWIRLARTSVGWSSTAGSNCWRTVSSTISSSVITWAGRRVREPARMYQKPPCSSTVPAIDWGKLLQDLPGVRVRRDHAVGAIPGPLPIVVRGGAREPPVPGRDDRRLGGLTHVREVQARVPLDHALKPLLLPQRDSLAVVLANRWCRWAGFGLGPPR